MPYIAPENERKCTHREFWVLVGEVLVITAVTVVVFLIWGWRQ